MIKNVPPTIIGNTTNGAPTTTIGANSNAPINKNVKNQKILTYGIGFLFVVLLVVFTWKVLVPMFKKKTSAAADVVATAPGAVTGVTAVNSSTTTTTTKTTTESYTTSVPNKRGLIIKFNTPATSGGVNSSSIISYNVYLRAVVTPPDNKEYLVDKDSVVVPKPAFTKFLTGSNKDTYYEWNDSKKGMSAGGTAAELFIDGSIIAALTDGAIYRVGIQATNVNELSSPEITFSGPLEPYNKCKAGEDRGCGWDSDGINRALGNPNAPLLAPAFISLALSASGSYTGSTADDTVCTIATPAANTLYKFKSSVCVASGCTKPGDMLVNGVCTHINMPRDACVPPDLPAGAPRDGFILYNQKNPDGSLTVDNAGSNVYICDLALGALDMRTKSCETITGVSLPNFSKWGLQPGCLITCLDNTTYAQNTNGPGCRLKTCAADNPKPNAITYSPWPACVVATCTDNYKPSAAFGASACIEKTCTMDTPNPNAIDGGRWTGTWGSCVLTCINNKFGPGCTGAIPATILNAGDYLPNPGTVTLTYAGGMGNAPPTYNGGEFIFGKSNGVIGLYSVDTTTGNIAPVWDISSGIFAVSANGVVTLGTKTFTPTDIPTTAGMTLNTANISTSLKSFRITSTGVLVIKYQMGTSAHLRTMSISPTMMAPSAAATQSVATV